MVITNTGSEPINTWQVSWAYSDGSSISSSWNAELNSAEGYTASNLAWNSTIAAGQSVEFGFTGTGAGIATAVTGGVCQ
ncbi:cellulose-binding domain-containing protein [Agarivorans sp. B2Z047]|nr:cellulose-binding domain-containing protein [Agarivorans sp. B2Z047]